MKRLTGILLLTAVLTLSMCGVLSASAAGTASGKTEVSQGNEPNRNQIAGSRAQQSSVTEQTVDSQKWQANESEQQTSGLQEQPESETKSSADTQDKQDDAQDKQDNTQDKQESGAQGSEAAQTAEKNESGQAQAIAAMAYGTETVPAVYKIFGPGNQYVTAAKQQVSRQGVAIDMPAGPSEVAVIADASSGLAFVASDFLSQAEHGADSQSVLFTTDETILAPLQAEIERQLAALPRRELTAKALAHSRLVLLHDTDELMELVNRYAPEHLIIQCADYRAVADRVVNAGSVFLGVYTPESAGDYASGTNHTLPTCGYARAYSGVNLDSFVRKITFQEISRDGLQGLAPVIETMAAGEGLDAHKNAVTVRLQNKK